MAEKKDNRGWVTHKIHEYGHDYNYNRKENGKQGIETTGIYRTVSPGKAKDKDWDKKIDKQRSDYHN